MDSQQKSFTGYDDTYYLMDYEDNSPEIDIEDKSGEDKSPLNFWENKQSELISSTVDYNLGTLTDLVDRKIIDLLPQYQRRFRWDVSRQSRLIESFLMNVPIPPIYLNEDSYGKYSVIDGKQRLHAVSEFLNGRIILKDLEVFKALEGRDYQHLPEELQNVIKTRPTLRAIIILSQSKAAVKLAVFQRLNTGGMRLNPQEIRNSTYTGSLNDLILNLSVNEGFHRALNIINKERSAIYQEMRDAEFVLRFLTFQENWQSFSGKMSQQMNGFMESKQHASAKEIRKFEKDFLGTLAVVEAIFGENCFRRWVTETKRFKKQVIASIYDAQMFACKDWIGLKPTQLQKDAFLADFTALFLDSEFNKTIDANTNTPSYFRKRINAVSNLLSTHFTTKSSSEA